MFICIVEHRTGTHKVFKIRFFCLQNFLLLYSFLTGFTFSPTIFCGLWFHKIYIWLLLGSVDDRSRAEFLSFSYKRYLFLFTFQQNRKNFVFYFTVVKVSLSLSRPGNNKCALFIVHKTSSLFINVLKKFFFYLKTHFCALLI